MSKPPLTLNEIRKSEKITPKNVGVAELLSKQDRQELRRRNMAHKSKKRAKFDKIDAYMAEIIARFGYDTYEAWIKDKIDDVKMARLIEAERARERAAWLPIESLICAVMRGGIPTYKTKRKPSIAKEVPKILKDELKRAKGEV